MPAGPAVEADPAALAQVQQAILTGQCLEFDYLAEGASAPAWRRVAVYGLVHGPVTDVIGKMPTHDKPPVPFRLDRMAEVRLSNTPGFPPDDWDLDAWQQGSFGIWREEDHDVVLRVLPAGMARAKASAFIERSIEQAFAALASEPQASWMATLAERYPSLCVVAGPGGVQSMTMTEPAE